MTRQVLETIEQILTSPVYETQHDPTPQASIVGIETRVAEDQMQRAFRVDCGLTVSGYGLDVPVVPCGSELASSGAQYSLER